MKFKVEETGPARREREVTGPALSHTGILYLAIEPAKRRVSV